jgi:hypothetical protein
MVPPAAGCSSTSICESGSASVNLVVRHDWMIRRPGSSLRFRPLM